MKRLQQKNPTGRCFLLLLGISLIVYSCDKDHEGYEKVTAQVGIADTSNQLTVPDTSKVYAVAELDISQPNDAVAYDVYFRFNDPSVINQLIKISHATFTDPASGTLYYRIPVARGIKKAAFTFIPINTATGDKEFSITLFEDLTGNQNYLLDEGRKTVTVNLIDK
jgi:hypothetical protein